MVEHWKPEMEQTEYWLNQGKVVLFRGVRGIGKTTIMQKLEARYSEKYGKESVEYIDLEDPRLAPRPTEQTLEVFTKAALSKSRRRIFLLIDEIERVKGWENWLLQKNKKNQIGILASSSRVKESDRTSKNDLIKEFFLYPLSFRSWTELMTDISVDNRKTNQAVDRFIKSFTIHELFYAKDPQKSSKDYLYKCLYHDVLSDHEIRDVSILTAISVYLISSTGRSVSASHLKGILSRSIDQARWFLGYLEETGLIVLVPRLEDENRDRPQTARRVFSADCGLSIAMSSKEPQLRDLAETAVFQSLLRQGLAIRAWRHQHCYGLAVLENNLPAVLIQVSYGIDDPKEGRHLPMAMKAYGCPNGLLLGDFKSEEKAPNSAGTLLKMPLWSWLLNPRLPCISQTEEQDRLKAIEKESPASPKEPDFPTHLL